MAALSNIRLKSVSRPAILYSDGIGDTLLSLPTLRALSQLLSGRAVFIGSQCSLNIIDAEGIASELIVRLQDPRETAGLLKECDLLISVDPGEPADYAGEMMNVLQPAWTVGWPSNHKVALANNDRLHFVDEVFLAAAFFDRSLRVETFAGPPRFGVCELDFAIALARGWKGYRSFVVHCETSVVKMWPIESFRGLIETVLSYFSDVIVLIVGEGSHRFDDIPHGDRVISCEGLPLAKSMALVACADAFIGVDSSMLHVADLFLVPAIGLFGPTDPERWGCRFTVHEHICARGGSLDALSGEEVVARVIAFLSEIGFRQ
ncbi:hypothetical protein LB565_18720 [Mesorhizobium sp. CA14]|uniref:glycosyltransferase family 9 protein n=1 Tax=Mesorhizobium sp. CA14 TaxID=2876642 RepID=UPI001CCED87A|nr:glycosyltransferase family 9 protein [Mesorhizobium sp. CA14]MBZ9850020.1 hypothetical protein [Mesorhizobium sp. CA14]